MAVAVTATPSSGSDTVTAFRIDATGIADNVSYYFEMSEGGVVKGTSHVFQRSSDGKHSWQNVITPDAGTYVFSLKKESDDATVASVSVTIS